MEAESSIRIHVVIVTHDPGLWFDEMLESVAAQDHPGVEVTVVDTGSEADPTARVHRFLPQATVLRLGGNPGFAVAANRALDTAPRSGFLVVCHDDVSLAPNALRLMAEEAVGSNAGIIGPKYVDWDDPSRIRQVGLMVDRAGGLFPTVEAGELDQQQHDAVEEVFAVPGGCVLVREDLFRAVGGFDPEMPFCYEQVDLCWRARIRGARVMVAPSAVVRHRQKLAERLSPREVDRLSRRHRVRTLLSVHGFWHSLLVIPRALVLAAIELLAALINGHPGQARRIAAAWGYNLVRPLSIHRRRQAIGRSRHVSDADIRRHQVKGYTRWASSLLGRGDGHTGLGSDGGPAAQDAYRARMSRSRGAMVVGIITAIVILLGARGLITGGIPAAGGLPRLGSSSDLLAGWWSESRPVGLGQEGFAPTGLAVLTLLSWLFIGETDLLRTVLIVGMVPLGALGMWRIMRPFDFPLRVVALAVYLACPVPYNALANGVWGALLLYGIAPWLLRAVLAAAGLDPFHSAGAVLGSGGLAASHSAGAVLGARLWAGRGVLAVGLLMGLVVAMAPEALIVVALMAVGLALGSLLAGTATGVIRLVLVVLAGAAVGAVLNLPWLLDSGPSLLGNRPGGGHENSWAELLRFDTGPFGDDRLGWALPVAALLPLVLAHDSRLAWAVRGWTLYLGTAAVALAGEQGWSPVPLPRPEVVQVPGAVGLAIAVAMGVAAFQVDVRRYRFGWRQIVPLTALAALVAGMFPLLAAVSDGDWNATGDDYGDAVADVVPLLSGDSIAQRDQQRTGGDAVADVVPLSGEPTGEGDGRGGRVLWIGHPDVLPLGSWKLSGRLSFAISDRFPTVAQRWVGELDDHNRQVGAAVVGARTAGTKRLGAELARWGIDTILVAERLAPAPYGELSWATPKWLLDLLDDQLDLVSGRLAAGITTYRNVASNPAATELPVFSVGSGDTSGSTRLLLSMQVVLWAVALFALAYLARTRRRSLRPGEAW
ncbi:glycosyltransferase [Candidatus Poriferisocius sp.]|uniref:glycosyltransferase n=1 Tax=Candidatus Poriferisocius sp. TaxID=3101276 RepID=UPI003B027E88